MIAGKKADRGSVLVENDVKGDVNIGPTFEEHRKALKKDFKKTKKLLERAHTAEKQLLQSQLDTFQARLRDAAADYQKLLEKLANAERLLKRVENQVDPAERLAADDALKKGDLSIADAIFEKLSAASERRAEDANKETAEFEFARGEIAERDVRWHDATKHFYKAASLDPSFQNLFYAQKISVQIADYPKAHIFSDQSRDAAKNEFGYESKQHSNSLNSFAGLLHYTGKYVEAENRYRQAMTITQKLSGGNHPDMANNLNNLAGLLKDCERFSEAEPMFRKAIKIWKNALGEENSTYATFLNNFAMLLKDTKRFGLAETNFRKVLMIRQKVLGVEHPDFATSLNDLALLLNESDRKKEAEPLFRQALKIWKKTLGETHPHYAISLNNLALVMESSGRIYEAKLLYGQAISILEKSLGVTHQITETAKTNLHYLAK